MLAAWNFGVRNHSSKTVKSCTHNYNVTIHAAKHFLCVYMHFLCKLWGSFGICLDCQYPSVQVTAGLEYFLHSLITGFAFSQWECL